MSEIKQTMSRRKRAVLWGTAVGASAATLAVPAALAWGFLHPPRRHHRKTPRSALGLSYERVRFRSSDGVHLRGWWILAPADAPVKGTVIVCHGYFGNRETMLPYAGFLHRAGWHLLLFDFRAHGWSGGRLATFGVHEIDDVRVAVDFALARDEATGKPVAVLGESMGASVALLATAEDERVCAVVADSPYARFDRAVATRLRLLLGPRLGGQVEPHTRRIGERLLGVATETIAPVLAAPRIAPRPVLLIQGLADRLIEPENAHLIQEAAREAGNVQLWEVPDAQHCQSVFVGGDAYAQKVTEFLATAIMTP